MSTQPSSFSPTSGKPGVRRAAYVPNTLSHRYSTRCACMPCRLLQVDKHIIF
ncbi:hypothetical protein C2E23DRAFT_842869 [Lenzites betulinus]|nr:hypothetical protein C2E23DRAFT_842869 [Lenzites betulinus]